MRSSRKIVSISLCSLLALSMFSACKPSGPEAPVAARICYDNLNAGYVAQEDMQYQIGDVTSVSAVDAEGNAVADAAQIATYDETTELLTAVSEGTVTLTLKDGSSFRVEVVPAYVTDPGTQYSGTSADYSQGGTLLGGCHDPSLIEVEENGKPAYYIFSTGWATGNEIRRSEDMLTWQYVGKATAADTQMFAIENWIGGESKLGTNATGWIQWWAPDIVEASDGGYWLYTCCVSNGYDVIDGKEYSKACIVLFHSNLLEAESFEYVGVLMQSCIPSGSEGAIDVNSIDPQIIYDTDGKMYMAYGSFGTGNWIMELDPETGLRKDDFYKDGNFLDWQTVREYRDQAVAAYTVFSDGKDVVLDYYGKMISMRNMEAPVIARHDNVTVSDENGNVIEEGKTYFYSMHSYNGLGVGYQMWGGRSENVMGTYTSVNGGLVINVGVGDRANQGNKYMGSFTWSYKTESAAQEIDIILPGHNDLFTTKDGTNIAAYITRTDSYRTKYNLTDYVFMVQLHQYYLNSYGDICINPNRYGGEIDRSVSKEELLAFTDGGKFQMVVLANDNRTQTSAVQSVDIVLGEDGSVNYGGTKVGTYTIYGKGYIKFSFTNLPPDSTLAAAGEGVYYGVVRPAWLNDQNKSGFTITCLGHSIVTRSMAMFMNGYSTITGDGLVG